MNLKVWGEIDSAGVSSVELEVEATEELRFPRNPARFSLDENGFCSRGFCGFLGFFGGCGACGAGWAEARISAAVFGILGAICIFPFAEYMSGRRD